MSCQVYCAGASAGASAGAGAADVELDATELAELEDALSKVTIHGDRKDTDIQKLGTIKAVATH